MWNINESVVLNLHVVEINKSGMAFIPLTRTQNVHTQKPDFMVVDVIFRFFYFIIRFYFDRPPDFEMENGTAA